MSDEAGDDSELELGWKLTSDDRNALQGIADAVRQLSRLARSGSDLIAVGEVWDAIDRDS